MKRRQNQRRSRRGAVAVLAACLLVMFFAMVAFAVDIGNIARVKGELQNAADAAALAGASQLMYAQMAGNLNQASLASSAIANAVAESQTYGTLNRAGNINLSLPAADVLVGYLANAGDQSQVLQPWTISGPSPNSVQVLLRRDTTANNPLGLFFAPVIGLSTWSGTASATATFNTGSNVTGFNSWPGGPNSGLLPIAVDASLWNTFMQTGKSADGNVHDGYSVQLPSSSAQPPGNVAYGGDNIPEFTDVYPNHTSPGNFGLVSLGPPATDTPSYRDWIDNGPTPADLAYFGPNGLQATPSTPLTLAGGPGLKSTLQSNLQDIVGQSRVIPLYSSYSGNGSNTTYTIVGFAGVTIVQATGHGSNMQVVMQPMITIDRTATSNPTPASGASFIYSDSPLQLSR